MPGPSDDVLRTIQGAQTSPGVSPRTREEAQAAIPPDFSAGQRAAAARDTVLTTAEAARTPGAQGVVADPGRANRILSFLRSLAGATREAGSGLAGQLGTQFGSFSFSDLNPLELNRGLLGGLQGQGPQARRPTKKKAKKKAKRAKKKTKRTSRRSSENLER